VTSPITACGSNGPDSIPQNVEQSVRLSRILRHFRIKGYALVPKKLENRGRDAYAGVNAYIVCITAESGTQKVIRNKAVLYLQL
jgi:hypothetical protein